MRNITIGNIQNFTFLMINNFCRFWSERAIFYADAYPVFGPVHSPLLARPVCKCKIEMMDLLIDKYICVEFKYHYIFVKWFLSGSIKMFCFKIYECGWLWQEKTIVIHFIWENNRYLQFFQMSRQCFCKFCCKYYSINNYYTEIIYNINLY